MNHPSTLNFFRAVVMFLALSATLSQPMLAQERGDTALSPVGPAANPILPATGNTTQVQSSDSALPNLPTASGAYVLRPGDIVNIIVYREADLAVTSKISEDGEITYPLLGQVKVGGLSAFAAQDLIRKKLDAGYIVNPQVSLSILAQSKQYFTVMGEVARPGIYELPAEGGLNLLQSIGMAGGFTRTAKYTAVQITRADEGRNFTLKVNARAIADAKTTDPCPIRPGDVITVPASLF